MLDSGTPNREGEQPQEVENAYEGLRDMGDATNMNLDCLSNPPNLPSGETLRDAYKQKPALKELWEESLAAVESDAPSSAEDVATRGLLKKQLEQQLADYVGYEQQVPGGDFNENLILDKINRKSQRANVEADRQHLMGMKKRLEYLTTGAVDGYEKLAPIDQASVDRFVSAAEQSTPEDRQRMQEILQRKIEAGEQGIDAYEQQFEDSEISEAEKEAILAEAKGRHRVMKILSDRLQALS